MKYEDAVAKYDPALGIEVHVELGTATKMFDDAPNTFGGGANENTTPTSLGLPGALPVVNRTAIEYAIRIGLALNCEIAESCRFARKNYFYPDLAKNFQTSQTDEPIAYDGTSTSSSTTATIVRVDIERAHMEEDAGKNTHVGRASGRIHGADPLPGRLQPRRYAAGRDRHATDHRGRGNALPRWRPPTCAHCGTSSGPSRVSEARMERGQRPR